MYNKWVSYSLLVNILYIDYTLVDGAFDLIKKYFLLNNNEGSLVSLYKLLGLLAKKNNLIFPQILDLIDCLKKLDGNGEYSFKEANLVINFIKTFP